MARPASAGRAVRLIVGRRCRPPFAAVRLRWLLVSNLRLVCSALPIGNMRSYAGGIVMTDFSLELNEDQLQIQKWVHDFAADVIRPAAPEWDEREETPWPIIEEAAKIGLYSLDFIANAFGDPTGLTFPVVSEELCWGDAGITLAILGTTLGVSGIVGSGTPEQIARVGAAVLRHRRRHPHRRVRGERARRRLRRVVAAHARGLRRGEGRVGASTAPRRGSPTAASRKVPTMHVVVAAVEPELKSRGHASFVVPAGHARADAWARSSRRWASAPVHTAEVVFDDVRVPGRCLLGGKEKLDARLARAREGRARAACRPR